MKPKVFITSTKNNTENDLMDAVKACFNQFGGVENIVKGNIFIKINATAVNVSNFFISVTSLVCICIFRQITI